MQADRCFACTGCPHAPRRGIGVRTRQRHLAAVRGACRACCAPRKRDCGLICAPRKRFGRACQSLACASRRATPKGVERAPGSGTLPPLCVIERREERGCRGAPLPRGGQGGGEEPPALRRRGSGHLSAKKAGRCAKRTLSGGSPASWLYWLYYRLSPYPKVKQGVFRHCRKTPCARTGTLPVWGGGGRSVPAGGRGQSPGPPEAFPRNFCVWSIAKGKRGGYFIG